MVPGYANVMQIATENTEGTENFYRLFPCIPWLNSTRFDFPFSELGGGFGGSGSHGVSKCAINGRPGYFGVCGERLA